MGDRYSVILKKDIISIEDLPNIEPLIWNGKGPITHHRFFKSGLSEFEIFEEIDYL
jgi:hypothetical protein